MDRNAGPVPTYIIDGLSLSARRAWIEILYGDCGIMSSVAVALRKESVDRNLRLVHVLESPVRSLSARRAWIEILG